ncbi:3'-5' exonuclease [Hymenobacter taeanensis]|uniref:3'-5' exonuclease n=1 Tax=Hymenobacter taeanensis TaxID=2735321 RepID=A0A6M6BGB0_9BACT|nr:MULTISPECIES: 3'-5' exonuclease [Hymenobacter]QJX47029.1 3'-5' exonuclease [Hymenobacter taeanensis]UOQ80907.1 3'-5' exonuclease [Hymenobacter sp. 5414T-23]
MRYISLDLETTGGKPQRHQILELAAVVEDTKKLLPLSELPKFRRVVRHPEYVGTAGALALNAGLLQELARKEPNPELCTPDELLPQLREFLLGQGFKLDKHDCVAVVMAGKNIASFDLGFLRELPGYGQLVRAEPAMLDPAAFYLNWRKDTRLPTMQTCKARAGFEDDTVAHQALADALDVVQLLRPFYELPVYQQARE